MKYRKTGFFTFLSLVFSMSSSVGAMGHVGDQYNLAGANDEQELPMLEEYDGDDVSNERGESNQGEENSQGLGSVVDKDESHIYESLVEAATQCTAEEFLKIFRRYNVSPDFLSQALEQACKDGQQGLIMFLQLMLGNRQQTPED